MQSVVANPGELQTTVSGLHSLGRTERLLVWTLRAIALGHEDDLIVVRAFQQAFGAAGALTLDAYCVFVRHVALEAAARLKVHFPGCPRLAEHEAAMVRTLEAAQHAEDGFDAGDLDRAFVELVGRPPGDGLKDMAGALARLLREGGCELSGAAVARVLH